MDLNFLSEYMVPVIIAVCLATGFIVKRWIADVDNKWIPTICAAIGLGMSVWMHWGAITPEVIAGGLLSGLAAVGIHQEGKTLLKGGKKV